MLDVTKLATLRAVVRHGSFSAAAAELHVTQPAVSRHVAILERQLGALLVRRSAQGVAPTEAGRVLAGHTDAVLARLELAESEVRELTGLHRGTVRLGSFLSALVHLSAEVGALLDAEHPGIVLVDDLVDRAAAVDKLRRGELDLAIVAEHDVEPAPPVDGVSLHPLFDDPVRVVLAAGHPLAGAATVAVADLAEETWIRPHEGSAARRLDHVLAAAGVAPRLLLAGRGDEPFEAQALVAAGKGVTLTHRLTVVVGGHDIAVRPLDPPAGVRRVQVALAAGPQSPAVAAALAATLRMAERHRTG
jgi:DNA-binding transcriptional LysR family regulator